MIAWDAAPDRRFDRDHAVVLTALYARGLARPIDPPKRRWPTLLDALRRHSATLETVQVLCDRLGWTEEATLLADAFLIAQAERLAESGRVLTAASPMYPTRWLERLHASAPPALWWNGVPFRVAPGLTIVGSRHVPPSLAQRVAEIGEAGVELGRLIVSGGAIGCDRAGALGAARAWRNEAPEGDDAICPYVEVLPCGLETVAHLRRRGATLSLCEPWAEFSSAQAMERNALLYAWSSHSVVGHCRLKEGGTWTGAVDAIRRRLSRVIVLRSKRDEGIEALIGLGATSIQSAAELAEALTSPEPQASFIYEGESEYQVSEVIEAT